MPPEPIELCGARCRFYHRTKLPLRAIAVNTGISTRDDLLAYTPDLLLEDQRGLTLPTILGPPIFDF